MKEKKNIDNLFKEQFKNFEVKPSPEVWKNIQAKLEKKEDRKVVPFWIKLGGIAALLALLFTVGNSIFNSPVQNNTSPIVTEDVSETEKKRTKENTLKDNDAIIETTTNKIEIASEEQPPNSEINNNKINGKKTTNPSFQNKKEVSGASIAHQNETQNASVKKSSIDNPTQATNEEVVVAKENTTEKAIKNNPKELINRETEIVSEKEAIAKENVSSKNNSLENIIKEENTKSIFDEINKTIDEEVAVITVDNKPDYRWEIAPNVGPVFYNSLSEGSSIDPAFSDNKKNNDVTISYGVSVSYNLNKRLSIRSGISNVNLSYSTSGVELGSGPVAASTSSINYGSRENVTLVVDKGTLTNQNPDGGFGDITPKSTSGEVLLNQNISYYEMPLELKYTLLNKKFGINIIGGVSTLLLGNNEISVEAEDFNEVLGEASNLSSLSFTTNLGLGLNYSFTKKLMFNIEPMFKYQLNPYTDSSVEFKPYYIGIYSGLSFMF